MHRTVSLVSPARGPVIRGHGPLQLVAGPAGPAFSFTSLVSVPWAGGLSGLLTAAAKLVGGDAPNISGPAVSLFDETWEKVGGDVRVGLAVEGDELYGWSPAVTNLLVPRGWLCDMCCGPVTDAARSLSYRSRVHVACRTAGPWHPPQKSRPATVCSASCLEEAAEKYQETELCHTAKLHHLNRARRFLRAAVGPARLRRTPNSAA